MKRKPKNHVWVLLWPDDSLILDNAKNPHTFSSKLRARQWIYNSTYSTPRVVRYEPVGPQRKTKGRTQ